MIQKLSLKGLFKKPKVELERLEGPGLKLNTRALILTKPANFFGSPKPDNSEPVLALLKPNLDARYLKHIEAQEYRARVKLELSGHSIFLSAPMLFNASVEVERA